MTTSFENTLGASWTTYTEELAYVQTILNSRLIKIPLGTSVQDREIYALRVGAASASSPPLIFEATIHGNEPAPREAALTWARDLASSVDPTISAFLDEVPIYIIPCMNPDGRVADTRNNANNIDLNRDFILLSEPETRLLVKLHRDVKPIAAVSGHEIPSTAPGPTENLEVGGISFYGAHVDLYNRSVAIGNSLISVLTGQSLIVDWYYWLSTQTVYSSTSASMMGATPTLLEANANGHANAGTPWERYEWLRSALFVWLDYVISNYTSMAAERVSVLDFITNRISLEGIPEWAVSGARSTPRLSGTTPTYVSATGYKLTAAQYALVETMLNTYGINVQPYGVDYVVWLNQPYAGQVVIALDSASPDKILSAERLAIAPPRQGWSIIRDGTLVPVSANVRQGSFLIPV